MLNASAEEAPHARKMVISYTLHCISHFHFHRFNICFFGLPLNLVTALRFSNYHVNAFLALLERLYFILTKLRKRILIEDPLVRDINTKNRGGKKKSYYSSRSYISISPISYT